MFYGSKAGAKLATPIVGVAMTPTGLGYYLVSARGNIYNFGDARFFGSPVHVAIGSPITSIAMTP
jgi:hypothetical protein